MSILISGSAGIDMGNLPVSNASQVEVQDNQVSPFGGFKNYIINGNFYIWQRGTSQTTTAFGSDDRWGNFNVNSTKVHSRVECTDTERALFNAQYFSRTVSTYVVGTSSFVMKSQTIENMTILAGKKVTVSFWAKANSNKVMNVKVTDLYGSGGTPTVSGTNTTNLGNVNLTSSWQKYSLTATLPSLVGKTLGTDGNHCFRLDFGFTFSPDRNEVVNFGMTAGQSGTFDIAQVQLEEGSIATPFENRPYGLELILCQRYLPLKIQAGYYGSYGSGYVAIGSTTYAIVTIPLATTSRSLVSSLLTGGDFQLVSGNATFNVTSFAVDTNNTDLRVLSLSVTCSGGGLTGGNACTLRSANSPDSYILLSNEV